MESLFLANILFCILDGIIEPSDEDSAMYYNFNGGRAMLKNWVCLRELDGHRKGLEALALSIYATMDLIYAVLSGNTGNMPVIQSGAGYPGFENYAVQNITLKEPAKRPTATTAAPVPPPITVITPPPGP